MTKGYLLDTNICISMLKNQYGVRETILKVKPENCYISEITLAELYFGASYIILMAVCQNTLSGLINQMFVRPAFM